jgi:cell wall-associated NlpC family hydrolase
VIAAANHIRTLPYIWGGGHGRWQDSGYDCSGAVSYALHGGRLLTSPLTSGSFEAFGEEGPGRWITIYANASHAYMVVAGLRFDTAGDTSGTGPRWHPTVTAAASGSYVARHPVGY